MANDYMGDLSKVLGTTTSTKVADKSTNKKAGQDLDMTDFLTLMVATFQNQTMDNTASTSDMMNQMVQMSVVQAISNISTLISDSTVMTYAASLVGKTVTVGEYVGNELKEIEGEVTGTGTLSGKQVIFVNGKSYYLTDIMAVGTLPPKEDITPDDKTGADGNKTEAAGSASGSSSSSSGSSGSTPTVSGENPDGTPHVPSSI